MLLPFGLVPLLGPRPAFFVHLPRAPDAEGAGGDVFGDGGAGGGPGAFAQSDRGDEGGVGADEGVRADDGAVLVHPVVVTGDGPRADVGARADLGVAEVRQMARREVA